MSNEVNRISDKNVQVSSDSTKVKPMKPQLVFTELKTEEYVKPLDKQDLSFLGLANHYVKSNYDAMWCNFIEGDEVEAITHAKQEIEPANIHTGDEQLKHLRRAYQDLSNYLIAISYLHQEECITSTYQMEKLNYYH